MIVIVQRVMSLISITMTSLLVNLPSYTHYYDVLNAISAVIPKGWNLDIKNIRKRRGIWRNLIAISIVLAYIMLLKV